MFFFVKAKIRMRSASSLLVVALLLFTHSSYSQHFLRAKGKIIVDGKDEKVILRGMGLGGWMLQEGYMFHINVGPQYKIRSRIEELVGAEKTNQFYEQWLSNHTTKADIDSMAAWGFNSVRLPMHYGLFTLPVEKEPVAGQNTWIEKGFVLTDSLLNWCRANKMYLILDMHATPGGQGNDLNISDRDASKPSLWQSQANQDKLIALWKKLAIRYANEQWIGGYDIINEPNWGFDDSTDTRGTKEKNNAPLRKLMMDITKAIREVDAKHIIIIEGNGFGNNYNGVFPVWDNNLVMSFHKYGNFNDTASIRHFLELRDQYSIPLWLGESGENSNTWFTEAIRLAETNDIGWTWWQEKKMGINNPLQIKEPAGYDKIRNYWSGKGAKPSADEAWAILQEWITDVKISNNIFHPDVIDAMFRQVYSPSPRSFRDNYIDGNTTINATDFDMGPQHIAYFDRDSASYHYTPGVRTIGNKGYTYRNDGVDIQGSDAGNYIFSIEDGEWLQYTVRTSASGKYTVSFKTSADKTPGQLSLLEGDKKLINRLTVPDSGGSANWQLTSQKDVYLKKGVNCLRVYADKGGFNLSSIQFEKQK
jgi:endoglucanase